MAIPLGRPTALTRPPVTFGWEAKIRWVKHKTFEDLKEVVSDFVASLDEGGDEERCQGCQAQGQMCS